jgi:hypothetical protein
VVCTFAVTGRSREGERERERGGTQQSAKRAGHRGNNAHNLKQRSRQLRRCGVTGSSEARYSSNSK